MAMTTHTVKELHLFLIARGVVVRGQRRLELANLCEIALELNLQVDPDNLIEDRSDATNVCPFFFSEHDLLGIVHKQALYQIR